MVVMIPQKNHFPKLRPVTEEVKYVGVTLLHPMFESNIVGKVQCTSELLGASELNTEYINIM